MKEEKEKQKMRKRDEKKKNKIKSRETDFEKAPRRVPTEWKEDERDLLPTKTKKGVVKRTNIVLESDKDDEEEDDEEEEDENDEGDSDMGDEENDFEDSSIEILDDGEIEENLELLANKDPRQLEIELFKKRNESINNAKYEIAQKASSILENPEQNFSKISSLMKLIYEKDITIKKLAVGSIMSIFKDVRPGYRLRLPTEEELNDTVSKDVLKRRKFEATLLESYRKFLLILEHIIQIKQGKINKILKSDFSEYDNQQIVKFKILAIKCLSELLIYNPNFNFSKNIVTLLVPLMHSTNQEISQIAISSISSVFSMNKNLDSVLEAVQLVTQSIKNKSKNKIKFFFFNSLLKIKI